MNKPIEPIFTTRPTVILVLPLAKNTRILHPEQIILKIGNISHDIGAFCYSIRSSNVRRPGQPREVAINSFLKQRPKQILQLINSLSRLATDNGKSLITVGNYAHQFKSFIDWADSNNLQDCLLGGESTQIAYRAWATETRESYLRQEIGQKMHNDRLDYIRELLEATTGLLDLGRGIRKVKELWNPNSGTEPLAPHDFAHAMALNQALFDGLCDLVLEHRSFPYKLALPSSLDWSENHLWLFPTTMWRIPPHQWGAEREKLGNATNWAYDYANGRLATPEEIAHRYALKCYPSRQRCKAQESIKRAQALIDTANSDMRHGKRIMLGMIAHKAFLFLFLCNTGGNEQPVFNIETNGEVDAATSNQQFRSIKFRAHGKAVTYGVPATFMPSLRRFMALRCYLLHGKDFPYLFFSFGARNEGHPAQITNSPLNSLYDNQLRILDPHLPRTNARKIRASVADWYQRHHDASVTAKVLQNTEQTAQKHYDAGSATDHRDELSLFLTSVSESAKQQRIIGITAGANTLPLEEGGHCDNFGHPEALADNTPIRPDCKDTQGCLFCKHRVLVACEDDTRKVASAAFVMEQVILGPLHEAAIRPLIAKCDEDLEKIANFNNCRPMVSRVRKDVFENANLTPFFADKYQMFLELGVIA